LKKTAQEEEDEDGVGGMEEEAEEMVAEGFHAAGLVDERIFEPGKGLVTHGIADVGEHPVEAGGVEALDVGIFVEGVVVVPGDEVIAERRGEDADGQEEEEER
jgi:hypothetical protein